MSDFNHFSIQRGNETQIVQKRKSIDIAYFLSLLTGGHCVDFQSD